MQFLFEKMRDLKAKDKINSVFIDFKSAYNTINRNKLFEILKKKEIFSDDELKFFRLLLDSVYYSVEGKEIYLENGVV